MRSTSIALLLLSALALSACGGGGGDAPASTSASTSSPTQTPTPTYTISGTVTGLSGSGLVLQNNGTGNLTVTGNSFTFAAAANSGAAYAITVLTQPSNPAQTCAITNGSGTVGSANITNVSVTCATTPASTFTVGGTVSGLAGSGLVLRPNVVGAADLPVSANGSFTFATSVGTGTTFSVTVVTLPSSPAQTCAVANGTGTITTTNVTNVSVTCSTIAAGGYTVGGTISGLSGTGLVLRLNGVTNLSVASNGAFTFASSLATGTPYAVTVLTQPAVPAQTCLVTNASGTMGSANVTNVTVNCTSNASSTYTVGGTVAGLAGTGLVLRLNGANDLPISSNGSFAIGTPLASGTAYSVTVRDQPTGPAQTCTVASGSGTVGAVNITNIAVSCSPTYTVGGIVTGLAGSGLVLRLNVVGATDIAVTTDGTFAFSRALNTGAGYSVSVVTQPSNPSQTCSIANSSGTMGTANVTNVAVTCTGGTAATYSVGGSVSGLSGSGLVLTLNVGGISNLAINANGPFAFPSSLATGSSYSVAVVTSPSSPNQNCSVTNGSGTVSSSNVTNVSVTCTTPTSGPYTIGGNVTGLTGSGLVLTLNGGAPITLNTSGAFAFSISLTSGSNYTVAIQTQPTAPSQTCSLTSGSGTVTNANIASIAVSCVATFDMFVFDIAAGVAQDDESDIRDGLNLAQQFFGNVFGRTVTGTITIHITAAAGSYPAYAGPSDMTFNTLHQVWTSSASLNKKKIAIHELFHVYQGQTLHIFDAPNGNGYPSWFVEGGAENAAYQGIAFGNLLPYATARRCQIFSMHYNVDPSLTLQAGGIPPSGGYWLAFMGIDYMSSSDAHNFSTIVNNSSTTLDGKVGAVLGLSMNQFYSNFESARQQYQIPAQYECP